MLVDTHAHLNFPAFDKDRNKIIEKCLENDLWLINIGSNYEASKKAVEISRNYPKGVYASIGLHPINLDTGLVKIRVDESEGSHFEKEFDYEKYRELVLSAGSGRVVAIGEIGLDYYWKPKTRRKLELFKEKQKELLLRELELAQELNLPVIFHCRMAHEDLLEILNYELKTINYKLRGVMHGFVGNLEQLQKYLEFGFYIGFNGITFKKIEGINFEENIRATPIEKILIETDCPYLTPPLPAEAFLSAEALAEAEAKEGPVANRNEPINVRYVAEKIAKIKNLTFDKVAEITTKNARQLFKI